MIPHKSYCLLNENSFYAANLQAAAKNMATLLLNLSTVLDLNFSFELHLRNFLENETVHLQPSRRLSERLQTD